MLAEYLDDFSSMQKEWCHKPKGSYTELSPDSMPLFDSGLSCIELLYPNVPVSMFHTKPNAFSLWLSGFSNCFRLIFFLTRSSKIACIIPTLLLSNFVNLKPPAAYNPLTLEIRSIAVSTSGDDFSISST